jgi:hypothetical protein
MTKRFLLVGLLIVSAGATVAEAATKPAKHAVTESLAVRVLSSDSTGALFTGTIRDKAMGAGAVVVKATGGQQATTNSISATGRRERLRLRRHGDGGQGHRCAEGRDGQAEAGRIGDGE